MTGLQRALVIAGLIILIIMSAFFIYRNQILSNIGDFLIIRDPLSPADVIHVIAGDDYRTEHAIQLYKQGYAKLIFFTGGWCTFHSYYHGEHGLQLALAQGIPREAIVYDDSPVLSTYDETLLVKKYLDEKYVQYPIIIVVSDPFHMRRAQWTNFHIFGNQANVLMSPVPFDQTPFKQQWWSDARSKQYVVTEYKKIVYYYFRYQLSFTWLSFLDKD
jgi:uncharacterized SAM-binding protein YcdF (DUF218 family)